MSEERLITASMSALPGVTDAQRQSILSAPRTEAAHKALLADLPAMNAVQIGGAASSDVLPDELTVLAWNVERCLFPEDTARHISQVKPDVVLLSEVDHGMARTAQRHTTEAVAMELGMTYAFGVEFHELGLGGPTERAFCQDDFNALGWHGNAILSSVPFTRTAMVRLDDSGHWYTADAGASDPDQPRIGGRMALLAELPTRRGPLLVVSAHLESNADGPFRRRQFEILIEAIDTFSTSRTLIIGGDLNTGNHVPPHYDWRTEGLFSLAEQRGYSWEFTADGPTTRPSLITPHPDRVMKLDWIAGRDVLRRERGILASLDAKGRPLSDHDAVWARVALA